MNAAEMQERLDSLRGDLPFFGDEPAQSQLHILFSLLEILIEDRIERKRASEVER